MNYTTSSSSNNDDDEESNENVQQTTGFWTATYTAIDIIFKAGKYNVSLAARERVKFKISSIYGYIGVIKLSSSAATINASSTINSSKPQQAVMAVGDVKKFDLTGDGYYDTEVNLLKISGGKANMTIVPINEKMPASATTSTTTSTTLETTSSTFSSLNR